MKELIMYVEGGRGLLKCALAGVGQTGKPQLIVLTPSVRVDMLERFKLFETSETFLLCEVGEKADSETVLNMLSGIFKYHDEGLGERFREYHDEMNRLGVELRKDHIVITTMIDLDNKVGDGHVLVRLTTGASELKPLLYDSNYKNVNELLRKLRFFFYFVEEELGIPVNKRLKILRDLAKKMRRMDKDMFDYVEVF